MKLIPLTQGKHAMVDDCDYEGINAFKWCAVCHRGRFWYAVRHESWTRKLIRMHRDIMSAPVGIKVDHRDHDGLNNRRNNIRLATTAENGWNQCPRPGGTSKYMGVYWNKSRGKWIARICANGKRVYLGAYTDQKVAARIYNMACVQYHGEFANLNLKRHAAHD